MKVRLAIAEDHKIFQKSVVQLLSLEEDIEIILLAENGEELLEKLKNIVVDVILMDIQMPVMDGLDATARVRQLYPHVKVIAYTLYNLESNIIKMYAHGVRSFVGKEEAPEELIQAIRIVQRGGAYMTEESIRIIQKNLVKLDTPQVKVNLSEAERLIVKMTLDGMTSKQIGEKLFKSHRTIEDIRENLYEKFKVKNKQELIALFSYRKFE